MGTHASKRGGRFYPILMRVPAEVDVYVDGDLAPVGKVEREIVALLYRTKPAGRWHRRALVDGLTHEVRGHLRRAYVDWRQCFRVSTPSHTMKMKTLSVSDYCGHLDPKLMARIERAVRLVPLFVPDRKRPLLLRTDWRQMLAKFMRRLFPRGWVYLGGSHIAIHSSPPEPTPNPKTSRTEAGMLLFRIIEVTKERSSEPQTIAQRTP